MTNTIPFWEARAARFAGSGRGLRAVCSYAMPNFYNAAIDITQRAALRRVLRSIPRGARVLDYGCGVGRWSSQLARRGAEVTGVDFSEVMLSQARLRAEAAGLAVRFLHADVTALDLHETFDVIIGITVLQHVVDDALFSRAFGRLARHLRPGGRLVLLEAAPTVVDTGPETETFRVRGLHRYLEEIRSTGLTVTELHGVDPAPFKQWLVPRLRRAPRRLGLLALGLSTLAALPIDLLLAEPLSARSWHKIIVAKAAGGSP